MFHVFRTAACRVSDILYSLISVLHLFIKIQMSQNTAKYYIMYQLLVLEDHAAQCDLRIVRLVSDLNYIFV